MFPKPVKLTQSLVPWKNHTLIFKSCGKEKKYIVKHRYISSVWDTFHAMLFMKHSLAGTCRSPNGITETRAKICKSKYQFATDMTLFSE